MANYCATARTNYFRVTDEEKYKELFANLTAEDDIHDFTEKKDGVIWHGFGSYGSITYKDPKTDDYDDNLFARELQKILPEKEAFMLFEAGHEKLRYVVGSVWIITQKQEKFVDLENYSKELARKMLDDPDFDTKTSY